MNEYDRIQLTASPPRKAYLIVAAALLMQLCLGSVYAWSSFVPELRRSFGYSAAQTQLVFGLIIGILCCTAFVAGRIQDTRGPRLAAVLSGIFTGSGYLVAGFFGSSLHGLILGISVLCGLGSAFGYLPAIATAIKWFPERKGLVAGIVLAGYGLSSIILSAVIEALLENGWQVLGIYKAMGVVYGSLVLGAGLVLELPEKIKKSEVEFFRRSLLLRSRSFWNMSIGIFCATYPGLAIIGSMKPIGLWCGFGTATAVGAISSFAVGNGSGRIVWGLVYDRLKGRMVLPMHLATVTLSVALFMAGTIHPASFLASALLLGFCYGGGLVVYPSEAALRFGVSLMGTVYPLVLLTHGAAGLFGAPLMGLGLDLSGSYWPGMILALTAGLVGTVACCFLSRNQD